MGIAKPMLSIEAVDWEPDEEYFAFVMPMTSPCELKSAPPEFPELMAQSVWMRFIAWLLIVIWRFRALTVPDVSEKVSSPRGFPIATTSSPTCMSSESPKTTGVKPFASTLRTAMSLLSS